MQFSILSSKLILLPIYRNFHILLHPCYNIQFYLYQEGDFLKSIFCQEKNPPINTFLFPKIVIDCWTKGKGRFCKWSQAIKVATLLRTRLRGLWTAPSATLNGGSSIWTGNAKRLTHIKRARKSKRLKAPKIFLTKGLPQRSFLVASVFPLSKCWNFKKKRRLPSPRNFLWTTATFFLPQDR